METSKGERSAIIDLGQQLHLEQTGRPLRPDEYPCQDVMWQLMELMSASEQGVIDLLNDYRSKAGQADA